MSSPERKRSRREIRSIIFSPILALCSRFVLNIRLSDGFAIVPGGLHTGAATCLRETIGYLQGRSLHTLRLQHRLERSALRKLCQTRKGSSFVSPLEAGDEASGDALPEMEQVMGSIAPSWAGNDTVRLPGRTRLATRSLRFNFWMKQSHSNSCMLEQVDRRSQVVVGSVIAANQTEFPYPIDSFPPLINSEVYYNGTSERFWWNQNAEAVCVYVPVPPGFDVNGVEFVAKTGFVSLKLEGEEHWECYPFTDSHPFRGSRDRKPFEDPETWWCEVKRDLPILHVEERSVTLEGTLCGIPQVLSGTPFYGIDGYQSLFVLDHENDPAFVQLELYKLREYQNWEDFLVEGSTFIPGGGSR